MILTLGLHYVAGVLDVLSHIQPQDKDFGMVASQ